MVFSREENILLNKIEERDAILSLNFEEKVILFHLFHNGLSICEAASKMNSSFNHLYKVVNGIKKKLSARNSHF